MKVTVTQGGVVERKSYPYIGKDPNGILVGFYAPRKGSVVANNDNVLEDHPLFTHREDWNEENFREFDGEITIRN